MNIDKSVVEKIQKLLALANSDNENEAKLAMSKANELIVKYNLSIQQLENHSLEYEIVDTPSVGLNIKPYQHMITDIIEEFFFVKTIINNEFSGYSSGQYAYTSPRTQYKKNFKICGTPENVKIATYIYTYLMQTYPRLFQDYYERNSHVEKTASHKLSYYKGLTDGLKQVLDQTKTKVETETGLVLKDDPQLKQFVEDNSTGSQKISTNSRINSGVYMDGVEHGKDIKLRKPLESSTMDSGRYLKGK